MPTIDLRVGGLLLCCTTGDSLQMESEKPFADSRHVTQHHIVPTWDSSTKINFNQWDVYIGLADVDKHLVFVDRRRLDAGPTFDEVFPIVRPILPN